MGVVSRLKRMETRLRRRKEDYISPATYAAVERAIAQILAEPDTPETEAKTQAVIDDVKRACGLI